MSSAAQKREREAERSRVHSVPESIKDFVRQCPRCNQRWLIVNSRKSDRHLCASCGHIFPLDK